MAPPLMPGPAPRLIAPPPPNEPPPRLMAPPPPPPPDPPPPPPLPCICTCSNGALLLSDMSARIGAAPAKPIQSPLTAVTAEASKIARPVIRPTPSLIPILMSCNGTGPPPRRHGDQTTDDGMCSGFRWPARAIASPSRDGTPQKSDCVVAVSHAQNRTALRAVLHGIGSAVCCGPLPTGAGALPDREGGVDIFIATAAGAVTLPIAAIAAGISVGVLAGGISVAAIGPCRAVPTAMVAMPRTHGFGTRRVRAPERQRRRRLHRTRGHGRKGRCAGCGAQHGGGQHRLPHWLLHDLLSQ